MTTPFLQILHSFMHHPDPRDFSRQIGRQQEEISPPRRGLGLRFIGPKLSTPLALLVPFQQTRGKQESSLVIYA